MLPLGDQTGMRTFSGLDPIKIPPERLFFSTTPATTTAETIIQTVVLGAHLCPVVMLLLMLLGVCVCVTGVVVYAPSQTNTPSVFARCATAPVSVRPIVIVGAHTHSRLCRVSLWMVWTRVRDQRQQVPTLFSRFGLVGKTGISCIGIYTY